MGFRRRVRRRALVAGAVGGAALAHHAATKSRDQQYDDQAPADDSQDRAPAGSSQDQAQYAPPPADPADEIEHLAQLHTSGALSDEEFAAAKARILGT
jgi:Short C-terminal domain